MSFFPELKEEKKPTSEWPTVLFATNDGWYIEEDMEFLGRLEEYDLSEKIHEEIYDFVSQGKSGSFLITDIGVVVILETGIPKSN